MMGTVKVSVIVPTYNERETLEPLLSRIDRVLGDYEVIVVDDNSPDGTGELAINLSGRYPVRLVLRPGKLGLASAIRDGFRYAQGDIIGVIDADLQHPPETISKLLTALNDADIALASKYIKGSVIKGWSWRRRLVSRGGILLARPLTRVKDPLSGFFFLRRSVIVNVRFKPVGYKIGLEVLVKGEYDHVAEVPYTFHLRQRGKSKLGTAEYGRYLTLLLHLYLYKAKKLIRELTRTIPIPG